MNEQDHNSENTEVIVIDNPETIDAETYTGSIISSHEGYAFLGDIRRGYETIATNGDVFAVMPEGNDYKPGDLVQFRRLEPDSERAGKFRTETVCDIIKPDNSLTVQGKRIYDITTLSRTECYYHKIKKIVEDTETAKKNDPFSKFIESLGWILNHENGYNPDLIQKNTERFILEQFPELAQIGVNYSIDGTADEAAEDSLVKETAEMYRNTDLTGQAESLEAQYKSFCGVRKVFNLMLEKNMLRPDTIVDKQFLPEITFAMPVWYLYSKTEVITDQSRDDDPNVPAEVKRICDLVGSKEYTWFFQIYNRRTRPLSMFKGKDIMPPNIARIIPEAKKMFDAVAILTPYHDVASKEWSDPNWLRNIDPLLIGILHDLPYVFILGRWSGTGLFPLMLDMIADTANHIRLNKHLLSNFVCNTYWYKGDGGSTLSSCQTHRLPEFADKLLEAYDEGKVFQFLRGELNSF